MSEAKIVRYEVEGKSIDTIIECNGSYFENGYLAFEPVRKDATIQLPSAEALLDLVTSRPSAQTDAQILIGRLLDRLYHYRGLTYGAWLKYDDVSGYDSEKAHAEAWRAAEKLLAPLVAKERLNDLFGRLKLDTRVIGTAKKAFAKSGDTNAFVEAAQSANGDKVELYVDDIIGLLVGLRLCVRIRPLELLNINDDANIVLVRPDGQMTAADRNWDSSLGLFTVPFGHLNQLNGAKLRAV